MNYGEEEIKVRLKTQAVLYNERCLPVDPSIYRDFQQANKDRPIFDLWEMSRPNSPGWVGVIDERGQTVVEGLFKTYLHQGSYRDLMAVCQNIARQHPRMAEFYCIYLNSPDAVAETDLRTKIVFREDDKA